MKSLFDPKAQAEILARLEALTPATQARWGTMDVAQMLAHCGQGLLMPTGELPVKAGFPILIGWMSNPETGAAIHKIGMSSTFAPSVSKIRLTLAFCRANPNWMPT